MKKVCIVGTAVSSFEPNYDDPDTEFWLAGTAFGLAHQNIKKAHCGFEIHEGYKMLKEAEEKKIDYNRFGDIPIYVINPEDNFIKQLIHNPVRYPKEDIDAFAKRKFYSCTFDYMFLLAVMMGFRDISFYGILLAAGGEYFLERPGLEYWIETMMARYPDLKVHFPEDAELFTTDVEYGWKDRPNIWKMKSFRKHLFEQVANEVAYIEQHTANANKNLGALEMYYLMKNEKDEKKLEEVVKGAQMTARVNMDQINQHKVKYHQMFGGLQISCYMEDRGM